MKKLHTISSLLLLGLVLVFIIQNATTVEVQFIAWSFSMPRALLIIVLLVIGFILGFISHSLAGRKRSH